jgi:hypothetical protein
MTDPNDDARRAWIEHDRHDKVCRADAVTARGMAATRPSPAPWQRWKAEVVFGLADRRRLARVFAIRERLLPTRWGGA